MKDTETNSDAYDPLLVPTREVWESMSEYERDEKESEIMAALEREFNMMGETTIHFDARASATEVLRRYFKDQGREVFVASDLHTLYPGERAFYPDLLVVYDVIYRHRRSWNVLREGKGLDFVLEILSRDTKRKDLVEKLNLYARLRIPEYFIFDPDRMKLRGFRLTHGLYQEMMEKEGELFSDVLGLKVRIDTDKIRFSAPEGLEIPFAEELTARLNEKISRKDRLIASYVEELRILEQAVLQERQRVVEERKRVDEEQKRAEEERRRAEEERKRAEEERKRAEEERKRAEEEGRRAEKAEREVERLRTLLKLAQERNG